MTKGRFCRQKVNELSQIQVICFSFQDIFSLKSGIVVVIEELYDGFFVECLSLESDCFETGLHGGESLEVSLLQLLSSHTVRTDISN